MWSGVAALITFSLLAILVNVPALYLHLKSHHDAIACLIGWILLLNLLSVINGSIWNNNDTSTWWLGYGLCDIEAKILVASNTGVPGLVAYILRQLANVVDQRRITLVPSKQQKRIDMAFMLVFCWGFPIFQMAVHYVVQPYRYAIQAYSGCGIVVYPSILGELLMFIWLPILCLIDCYYAGKCPFLTPHHHHLGPHHPITNPSFPIVLTIKRIHTNRRQLASLFAHSNTTSSRYMRRVTMIMLITLGLLPVELALFVADNANWVRQPYSWSAVHENWDVIPLLQTSTTDAYFVVQWFKPFAGFVVFVCLGLGEDARAMYKGWMEAVHADRFVRLVSGAVERMRRGANSRLPIDSQDAELKPKEMEVLGSIASASTYVVCTSFEIVSTHDANNVAVSNAPLMMVLCRRRLVLTTPWVTSTIPASSWRSDGLRYNCPLLSGLVRW